MTYTARSRDRYKLLAALTTGTVTFGAAAATGAATGVAARATAEQDNAKRQEEAVAQTQAMAAYRRSVQPTPANRIIVVTQPRPQRTVVHTRIVHQASGAGVAKVGSGSTVTAPPITSGGATSGGSSTTTRPAAPAPPPPPPPPPAPTSGS